MKGAANLRFLTNDFFSLMSVFCWFKSNLVPYKSFIFSSCFLVSKSKATCSKESSIMTCSIEFVPGLRSLTLIDSLFKLFSYYLYSNPSRDISKKYFSPSLPWVVPKHFNSYPCIIHAAVLTITEMYRSNWSFNSF